MYVAYTESTIMWYCRKGFLSPLMWDDPDNSLARWQMKFNVDKCTVMQVGRNNLSGSYTLLGSKLTVITQGKKDLGVTKDSSMKTSA